MFQEMMPMSNVGGGETVGYEFTLVDSWDNPTGQTTHTYNNIDLTKTYMLVIYATPSSGLHLSVDFIQNGTLIMNDGMVQNAQWTVSLSGTTLTITRTVNTTIHIRLGTLS